PQRGAPARAAASRRSSGSRRSSSRGGVEALLSRTSVSCVEVRASPEAGTQRVPVVRTLPKWRTLRVRPNRDGARRVRSALLFLLLLRPRILEGHAPVEDQGAGLRVRVDAEVAEALELEARPRRRIGK